MPPVKRIRWRKRGVLWGGECPGRDCDHEFCVEADPWMEKNEVLMEVRAIDRDHPAHLHGEFVITGYEERGGE